MENCPEKKNSNLNATFKAYTSEHNNWKASKNQIEFIGHDNVMAF